jgi:phospholipase C
MRNIRRGKSSSLRAAVTAVSVASFVGAPMMQAFAQTQVQDAKKSAPAAAATISPITHVIMIIGENRTFDHVFATYTPKHGETINNLLSEGIVTEEGAPGPNFARAAQSSASDTKTYQISPGGKAAYKTLPVPLTDGAPSVASDTNPIPFATVAAVKTVEATIDDGLPKDNFKLLTTGATGLPSDSADNRIAKVNKLPNGPFRLTAGKDMPYDAYTASPVHRFYQMWQQTDCAASHITAANPSGCLNDLFPWVEITVGAGTNGSPQAAGFNETTTGEGSSSMGFYSMAQGDVPYLKKLADDFTISDNFHQSIMGGTGANHIVIGTGLAMYYSDGQGHIATPPTEEIENPNPQAGTNNWWVQDGYSGGSYTNCSKMGQPGVKAVVNYLDSLPYTPGSKCELNAYYLLNNYNPGYFGDGTVNTTTFTIPPSSQPTIADRLNAKDVTWAYYGAGWNQYVKDPSSELGALYCNICNPFLYSTQIMTNAKQRTTHLKDVPDLETAIADGTLPAVSIVKPDSLLDGHPASSKLDLFEAFTKKIINEVKANDDLWQHTAILITWDEGGGYWDSGYIQPLDFFGDGTRIPAILVSPYSKGGHVSHTYADHVSFDKFVERNWKLSTITENSRDNLPNPVSTRANPYVPTNPPAIGDLFDMLDFAKN